MSDSSGRFSNQEALPEDLEEILQHVEEKLQVLEGVSGSHEEDLGSEALPYPSPIRPVDIAGKLNAYRSYNAPFILEQGSPVSRLIKRILNLPIKIFGRKQYVFNQEALEALEILNANFQALMEQNNYQREFYLKVMELEHRVDQLMSDMQRSTTGQGSSQEH